MVSIIIPVYKAEQTLPKCVDSCINQSYKDIEIILVDDGSPDSSPEICDNYAKKDSRIKVFHKKNGGVSSARNLGLDKAKGDFIIFVDSDDWIEQDMIEMMIAVQEENNYDLVLCNHTIHFCDQTTKQGNTIVPQMRIRKEIAKYILMPDKEHSFRMPWGKLYRSKLIHDNNLHFKETLTLGEDACFNYQYIAHISSVNCLSDYYGYNFRVIKNTEKKNRYYQSMDYLYNSRMIMFQDFTEIFRIDGLFVTYKKEISAKFIYSLSILENIAVISGFSRNDIIKYNRLLAQREYLKYVSTKDLRIRDKFTFICYRHRLFNLLFWAYRLYSFRYGGKN